MRALRLVLLVVVAACGGSGEPPPVTPDARLEGFDEPDLVCPGDPACASAGDGQLRVGAAKRAWTPIDFETYTDENDDDSYETGEPFTDKNGNGKFDAVWLFGGKRAAKGVTDDVEVRALAFVQGDTTVVVVYLDAIGVLAGDIDTIRAHPSLAGLAIDHVIIGATHAHEAPDTIGLWGPTVTESGRQQFVIDRMHEQTAAAIREAVESVQPAQLQIASTRLINDPANAASRTDDWNQDIRDPIIFDPSLTIARFVKTGAPTETIGTLVSWANHPEVARDSPTSNATITAHYPHWLRAGIEQGVTTEQSIYAQADLPGLGGITVFVQGALGGQIGSLRGTHPPGPDGTPITALGHEMEQALGTNAAARALATLAATGETVGELPLAVKSARFHARVDNTLFHVAILIDLLGPHEVTGYDPDEPIDVDNSPWLPIRSTYLQVGPLGMVTVPGELHPELWVGGYDGAWSWGWPMMDAQKPNAPNLATAPAPPYMRDLVLGHPGVRYPIVAGCAEDYLGYIIPAYNYALDPENPYIVEAEGDHYEETYSLGPAVEQHAIHPVLQLLQYRR